ncbi:MAG: coenzyme F420-0:L-glutamate ligase [Candidatus Freyarchaeota archaeon]|nr:coenzyme F420-0:L-glutamate ligase [Candidatus Jordarchaeia archaeon]
MILKGIKTRIIKAGDDLVEIILEGVKHADVELKDYDILVISSKVVALSEGRIVSLEKVRPSEEALKLAEQCDLPPEFVEIVLKEADEVYGGVDGAVLTLKSGILQANAGVDRSNAPPGYAILLPENPSESARMIRKRIFEKTGKMVAVLIVDSRVQPLRLGNTGVALGVAGLEPVIDERGKKDIYGRKLKFTRRAVADCIAAAAEVIMGERDERVPIVLVRDAPVVFTDRSVDAAEMIISAEKCMYMGVLMRHSAGH